MDNEKLLDDLVSVIIPVYNSEKYISETLNSVLNQTYKNIEIIIINDKSTDNTENIIENYLNLYANITVYHHNINQGVGMARNKGIELARGQYIAFIDSDDIWENDKIEKQVNLLKEKNGSFSYTAIKMINEDGEIIKNKRKIKKSVNYQYLLQNTMIATSSVMIDIKKKNKFKMPNLRNAEDYATWLMLLRDGTIAYGVDEALVSYRQRVGSLSSNKINGWKGVYNIQVNREGISKYKAIINCTFYCINAFKKYFF